MRMVSGEDDSGGVLYVAKVYLLDIYFRMRHSGPRWEGRRVEAGEGGGCGVR